MKNLGMLLIGVGLVWLIVAFNRETTVTTAGRTVGSGEFAAYIPSQTVHNIGLIEERRNHLLVAGVLTVVGVLLVGFGSSARAAELDDAADFKACPSCAEQIRAAAMKCRFCQADLPDSFRIQQDARPVQPRPPRRSTARLTEAEMNDMETFGITYADGYFNFADYAYETLSQAILHAKAAQRA